MKIQRIIRKFIDSTLDKGRPLLVGFSGGPDSRALFEALKGFPVAAAHVDHGWREESAEEARRLRAEVEKKGAAFHLKRLDPSCAEGNLEDFCRSERHRFFEELCKEYGYQGVALGHHAGDQAETVLKRLFEGASLHLAGAMKPVSKIGGLVIFRPLLAVKKEELAAYLDALGIAAFDDGTNRDKRFLRARMREEMLPFLENRFGKNVHSNLARIGEEGGELRDYLDFKLEKYRKALMRKKGGLFLDLNEEFPEHPYILKQVVKMVGSEASLALSRAQIDAVCSLLRQNKSGKRVETARGILYIGRRCLDAEIKLC